MFDPTEVICWRGHLYICRHCKTDYMQGSPLAEKLNPLRYEIGVRFTRHGPLRIRINRGGKWARNWANLVYRIKKLFAKVQQP